MKSRDWMFQYGVAILLALLLGVILGHIPLFQETTLGSTKLRAADLVQFLGYGGALVMFIPVQVSLVRRSTGVRRIAYVMTLLLTLGTLLLTQSRGGYGHGWSPA